MMMIKATGLSGAVVWFLTVVAVVVIGFCPVYAQDGDAAAEDADDTTRLELEEIVVTGRRADARIKELPKNVTVITSEEIEQSPSNNVVDLLAREAGITIHSLLGNDKRAMVDIRGMGASAANNVILLVDGVRMNAPDLSGADFSIVPLEQIERIEILRGAGSVVYGDGAVGGVINIVTKKGSPGARSRVYASYGSYHTLNARASTNGGAGYLLYALSGAYHDSDGYRDNGELLKKDVSGTFDYDLNDWITLNLAGAYHQDEYGLPGPVSRAVIDSPADRVKTDYPDDGGETVDTRISGGFEIDTVGLGYLTVLRGYRVRNNDYIVGDSPQTEEIEEFTRTLRILWDKRYTLFGREHGFQAGVDHFFTDYVREKEAPSSLRKNSQVDNLGVFLNNQWAVTGNLTFQWGYRENRHDGKFRTDNYHSGSDRLWVNGDTEDKTWRNNAWDLGLTYALSPKTTLFAGYTTSFRVPNVDELAQAMDDLKPQTGVQLETGGRFQFDRRMEVSLAFFSITIEDEIYYSEVNKNYDDTTLRNGFETDLKFYLGASMFVWGNYTYTQATFQGEDTVVPLVPAHKGSLGIEWSATEALTVAITGTYVDTRYDGNDVKNDKYDKLDAYRVVDSKVTYLHKDLKLFAGVNNVFDEIYVTSSFSERYYPMPQRNFYGGIEWAF